MAYNTMSVLRQSPYVINNNMGLIKKNQEEGENTASSSAQSSQAQTQAQEEQNLSNKNKENLQHHNAKQEYLESKAAQERAIASRDANLKNATINISQILKDFRSTIKAIGATPELEEEVNEYLNLVQKQVTRETPDAKLIRSNLKNASTILDNYITETLQRPSKVVENWLDALFLQQINFKYNENEINSQFLVKFPDKKKEENQNNNQDEEEKNQDENSEDKSENNQEKAVKIPFDEKLKSLFIKAKKYSYANNSQKAMNVFKLALDRAVEIEDRDTESKILFEIGKIYDKNDYLSQALTSYNKSLSVAADINVKTKAHYSMAQIYDDVAQFESAINHYLSSISYAGEVENFDAQSTSLVKIGNIYSDEYKKEAFDFLNEAEILSKESKCAKIKGFVSGNIANAYNKFNKPKDALKYYSCAIKDFQEAELPAKVAVNYKRAAELMEDFDNTSKARTLYKKALSKAKKANDMQLIKEIHDTLNKF